MGEREPGEGRDGDPSAEADLVGRAARGDGAAQRAIYDRFRPLVHRIARSFPDLDPDDASDVVQESFVRAFRALPRLQDPARLGPWLLTIARNRALTRLARKRARAALVDELTAERTAHGEEAVEMPDPEAGVELELVRRLIDDLPEGPEKETVHLFYVDGTLSARQIADRLGVGKSAITMRLERFRTRVKRRLLAEVARLRGEGS